VDRKQQQQNSESLSILQGMRSDELKFYVAQILDAELPAGNRKEVTVKDRMLEDGWI
jgi:hypothetical protein